MFENGKLFNDYKTELINRWGYDEELAMDIVIMANSLINEYGVEYESAILNAIESCKYVIANEKGQNNRRETVLDVLKRENILVTVKDDKSIIDETVLKNAQTAFVSKPNISFDGNSYHINNADRLIVLPSTYNSNNPDSIEKLAISTDRLIKAYLNGFEIKNDALISRTGLAERRDKLSTVNGEVVRTFESEVGLGIEDGLSSYTALRIMREQYQDEYDVQADTLRNIGGVLIDGLTLGKVIREAEMAKDDSTIRAYIDKYTGSNYDDFRRDLDQLLSLEYARKKAITNAQDMERISRELDTHFENNIAPKMSMFTTKMRLEGNLENVTTKGI